MTCEEGVMPARGIGVAIFTGALLVSYAVFAVEADVDAYRADLAAKSAARYGYTVEEWNAMTTMERLRVRQEARAIKAGFTK